ncbi:hypothetical protein ABZW02_09115 [Streptomyces sp. NPDC005180]
MTDLEAHTPGAATDPERVRVMQVAGDETHGLARQSPEAGGWPKS